MLNIILFLIVLAAIYFYNTRTFKYWAKKGVKHDKPVIFFGNNSRNFLMQMTRCKTMEEMYFKFPEEKVVGFYRSSVPELVLRDPDIIKKVMVTDFAHFHYRGIHPDKDNIELSLRNLFLVEGDLWKMLRQRLTPAFTSGKLKAMFPLIVDRAEKLLERAKMSNTKSKGAIDARDLMARYATDFIGSVGFGLDADSLSVEDSEFRKLGHEIFNLRLSDYITFVLKEIFPKLFSRLKYYSKIEANLLNLSNDIQKSRNYKPIGRNDFVDMLLEYRQKGPIEIESMEKTGPDAAPKRVTFEFDDDLMAGQVFIFFAAGFETSSSTTSYTLHELAYSPEIQKKVHKEIDDVLAKYDNKLCYDAVKEMKYLELCFKEAMRIFPAFGYLTRQCTRQYTFTDIDLTIDPGVRLVIPVTGLHNDPKYWDNPKEFRPERFLPENLNNVQKTIYLAFGEGPRNCIGSRLGLMQSLAGLAAVLSVFTVEPAPNSIRYPDVDIRSDIVQSPKGGKLPLLFRERKKVM